jgi:uncharacterized membrane protein YjjP (DUF1212 family)
VVVAAAGEFIQKSFMFMFAGSWNTEMLTFFNSLALSIVFTYTAAVAAAQL